MPIYSADDVLHIPIPPEIMGYELINGELVEVSPNGARRGRLFGEVGARVLGHIRNGESPVTPT